MIWPCNPTPGHISREKPDLKGYTHPKVHCSTIAKTWKQLKCPLIDEWINSRNIYIQWILLSHYTEWDHPICSNIDEPSECHIEWCKSDKGREIWHPLYVESKKEMIQMNLQNRKRLTDLDNKFMVFRGGRMRGRDS